MKAYKGFNRDMTCRGFQYNEGETYHTDKVELCEGGFHACEYPLDVLTYYLPSRSVYHEVELDEVSDERKDDSKVCAKTIKIGARMDIASLIKASVEYVRSKCNKSCEKYVTGDFSTASAAGSRSVASATGIGSAVLVTGNFSVASATGFGGAASATGYGSAASADNPTAIAVSWGIEGCAKGVLGAHIVCAEWQEGKLIRAKMAQVDGVTIKPDTYYTLENGEFVEV